MVIGGVVIGIMVIGLPAVALAKKGRGYNLLFAYFFDVKPNAFDSRDWVAAAKLFQGDGILARFFKKGILLNGNLSLATAAGAFTCGFALGIKKIKGKWFAQAFSIWKTGVKFHVNILIRERICVGKFNLKVVERSGICDGKFKIQGIKVGPLLIGDVFVFLKMIVRAAGSQAKKEGKKDAKLKFHDVVCSEVWHTCKVGEVCHTLCSKRWSIAYAFKFPFFTTHHNGGRNVEGHDFHF